MNITQGPAKLYARLWHILAFIIAVGYLLNIGKTIFCPLVFSFLFAILLLPMANFLEKKWHFHRMLASAVSVLLLVCVAAGVVYVLVWQVGAMVKTMPDFKQRLPALFTQFQQWCLARFNINIAGQLTTLNDAVKKLVQPVVIGTTLSELTQMLLFIVFIIFDTLFILFYRVLLIRFCIAIFKKENTMLVYDVAEHVQHVIGRYLRGLMVEMAVVVLTCCTAFWIAGIKYAFVMGLITGLFNIIPYAGIFTALLLNVLITLALATTGKVVAVIVIVVAMHLIDSNILLPFIVGRNVRINALITILGLALGALLWQIPGMFLSIPVIAILKIIFDRVGHLKPFGLLLGDEKNEKPGGG